MSNEQIKTQYKNGDIPINMLYPYLNKNNGNYRYFKTDKADIFIISAKNQHFAAYCLVNNIAIKGVTDFYKDKKNHIITCVTEHKCVLDSCRHLEEKGFKVTYLPVQANGLINLDDLKNAITEQTILVSIMMVNNEIGVINPISEI